MVRVWRAVASTLAPGGSSPCVRDDHAHRVATLAQAHGELGVVATQRAGADHDGIGRGAQLMNGAATVQTADPAGVAAGGGHLAVERHGGLVGHQRQPSGVVLEEGRVLLAGSRPPAFVLQVHLDAAVTQARQPAAVDQRVGVAEGDHGPPDPGRHERVGAGRRLALMTTGLECAVQRGAGGALARLSERHRLGVRLSGAAVPAQAHDVAVAHENGADQRIGVRAASTPLGQRERFFEVPVVVHTQNAPEPGPRADDAEASQHASLIRTVTVGPGISPGRPPRRLAGSYRRWGISPRPEAA